MGDVKDDGPIAAIANLVLCSVAGNGLSRFSQNWVHPGMHANCFVHGALGFLSHTGLLVDNQASAISLAATRFLPIPCLMADLYIHKREISALHLASGVVPFIMTVTGNNVDEVGHSLVTLNIISLCYYAMQNDNVWAWYTAGGAVFAYFCCNSFRPTVVYPLSLALMEYCAFRVFHMRVEGLPRH